MKKEKNVFWEWIPTILIAVSLAFVFRNFLFSPIVVQGSSMMPTLHNQEHMIVKKVGEPKRFDIIVFHATEDKDFIKRVIGLPGDRIEYKDDILYVNGKAMDEPYLDKYKKAVANGPLTESFKLEDTAVGMETVPEGCLFVMGDNRRESADSRVIGAVPLEKVVGTTNFVFWPVSDMGLVGK
jgi:signal peptidase I